MEYMCVYIHTHTHIYKTKTVQKKKYEEEIDLVSKKKQNDINQLKTKLTKA